MWGGGWGGGGGGEGGEGGKEEVSGGEGKKKEKKRCGFFFSRLRSRRSRHRFAFRFSGERASFDGSSDHRMRVASKRDGRIAAEREREQREVGVTRGGQ